MTDEEATKIAHTEAIFREVNERIAETANRYQTQETSFVCECADVTCMHRVELTLDEYEDIRADGATFVLVPGHEDERVETAVEDHDRHAVVEKRHPLVRPLVVTLDPRS